MLKPNSRLSGSRKRSTKPCSATNAIGNILKRFYAAVRKKDVEKSKLDRTLKNFADGMSKNSSKSSASAPASDLPGDPNCPLCGGLGYLRRDLPLGHPDF